MKNPHLSATPTVYTSPPPLGQPPRRVRKTLPHEMPAWVGDGSIFFITINCRPRGQNQLALASTAVAVEASLFHQQTTRAWWVHLFLLMPDHLHALVSFPKDAQYPQSIRNWKRFLARRTGIVWQRDFFDHRLRRNESLSEKWAYIRNNPVRKGLVSTADDWPYQWAFPAASDLQPPTTPPAGEL